LGLHAKTLKAEVVLTSCAEDMLTNSLMQPVCETLSTEVKEDVRLRNVVYSSNVHDYSQQKIAFEVGVTWKTLERSHGLTCGASKKTPHLTVEPDRYWLYKRTN
jgi:hypothetical protein